MLISVIVPIYGVEKYIEKSSRSILSQTYHDIEFIFVNDCTKDSSISILQNVIKDYPDKNIKIINKLQNEGLPQARKTGVLSSKGDYIIHFDSDDWVEYDYIEKMVDVALTQNSDIVIADYFINYSNKEEIVTNPNAKSPLEAIDFIFQGKMHSGVWNKLIRRNLYDNVTYPKDNLHEDLALMIQLIGKSNVVSAIHLPFYHYNKSNEESITNKIGIVTKNTMGSYNNIKIIENYLVCSGLIDMCEQSFSCRVNGLKASMAFHKTTRDIEKIETLYPKSINFVFETKQLPFLKRCLLYIVLKGVYWPLKIIDYIKMF